MGNKDRLFERTLDRIRWYVEPQHANALMRYVNQLVEITGLGFATDVLYRFANNYENWLMELETKRGILEILDEQKEPDETSGYCTTLQLDLVSAIVQLLYEPGYTYDSLLTKHSIPYDKNLVASLKHILSAIGTGMLLKNKQRQIVGLIGYQLMRELEKRYPKAQMNLSVISNDSFRISMRNNEPIDLDAVQDLLLQLPYLFYVVAI